MFCRVDYVTLKLVYDLFWIITVPYYPTIISFFEYHITNPIIFPICRVAWLLNPVNTVIFHRINIRIELRFKYQIFFRFWIFEANTCFVLSRVAINKTRFKVWYLCSSHVSMTFLSIAEVTIGIWLTVFNCLLDAIKICSLPIKPILGLTFVKRIHRIVKMTALRATWAYRFYV